MKKEKKTLVRLRVEDLKDINGGTIFWSKNAESLIYFVRGRSYRHLFSAVNAEKNATRGGPVEIRWCRSVFEARTASLREVQVEENIRLPFASFF